jgi:hypothetical protein
VEFRGTFDGELIIRKFVDESGGINGYGTLEGRTNSRYGPEKVDQAAVVTVLAISATCGNLHLEVGPLDPRPPSHVGLHLDRVAVDIPSEQFSPPSRKLLCQLGCLLAHDAPDAVVATWLNRLLIGILPQASSA